MFTIENLLEDPDPKEAWNGWMTNHDRAKLALATVDEVVLLHLTTRKSFRDPYRDEKQVGNYLSMPILTIYESLLRLEKQGTIVKYRRKWKAA